MDYILAIDQGTHASRALVLNTRGETVAQHLVPVSLNRPRPGYVEQDAGDILRSVRTAVRVALTALTTAQRDTVRCCGVTTQRSTVLAWSPDGNPLSAAINWQDTRGAPQLERLQQRRSDIEQLSGLPVSPHYGATKLHTLSELHTRQAEVHLGPLAAFLVQQLTGATDSCVDHSNAQRMQLLDIHTLDWSNQLCEWFDVPRTRLPRCRPIVSRYGELCEHAIPLTALAGDQNAAWFGAGAPPAGTARINLGSGAFVLVDQGNRAAPPGLLSSIVYSDDHDAVQYVVEGTVNGAGNALQWLQDRFQIKNLTGRLDAWLEQVSEPPLFLNTVGGLGSPWWKQHAAPVFVNDTGQYSDAERAAAVAESILFLLQYNLEQLHYPETLQCLRVSGGLSKVDALCRKLASLTGYPVQRADDSEASARGIAWLAAGKPANWLAAENPQRFVPVADAGLQQRYRLFIEHLRQHVADHNHD